MKTLIKKPIKKPIKTKTHIKTPLLRALYLHYIALPEQVFPQFKLGAMIFFLGLVVIYSAYQLLSPSLSQELTTLIGLLLIGLGFFIAMMAQVRMLIGRILRFFFED